MPWFPSAIRRFVSGLSQKSESILGSSFHATGPGFPVAEAICAAAQKIEGLRKLNKYRHLVRISCRS